MKNLIYRDYARRVLFGKTEKLFFIYKFILNSTMFDSITRAKAAFLIQSVDSKIFKVRIHNVCIETGRSHRVSRLSSLSHIRMREYLMTKGILQFNGLSKLS